MYKISTTFPERTCAPMEKMNVHPDISLAQTLPKEFYLSPQAFELSKSDIFARTWQWICLNDLPRVSGECLPVNLLPGFLDEPLVLTRDTQKNVHLLSNVCTHRGALLVQQACSVTHIRCPYHGRQFLLDGTFKSMPGFREVQNFPTEADNLHVLPLQGFAGSYFTRLMGNLSFDTFFGPMLDRLEWLPLELFSYRPELGKTYDIPVHWALYCENYLEGFHIPFVHPSLNDTLDFGSYRTELFEYSSLQVGIAKEGEDCFELPASSIDTGQRIAAYYWFVFPNLMFNFYPWGLSLNVVQPLSPERTLVHFHSFVWREEKMRIGAGADVDTTEMEDEEVVKSVQKGIRSRFYRHGRYSAKYETGTHHFHRLIGSFTQY